MGEHVEGAKNEGERKDDGSLTVVLKMNMHCRGCAKKVRRAVRNFEGVEDVKADSSNSKLTVTGKVDPANIKLLVEEKTGMKVEILSPLPKKDAAAPSGNKKPTQEEKKPTEKRKEEEKQPKQAIMVLKIKLHCDGCIQKIRKIITKIEGVDSLSIDKAKDLVTVTGMVDEKALVPYLSERFRRGVVVVPPPTKKDDSGGKKEGKESRDGDNKDGKEAPSPAVAAAVEKKGGGGGKENSREVKAEEPKTEVRRFEHHGYYPSQTSYWYDQGQPSHYYSHGYAAEPNAYHGSYAAPPPPAYPHMVHEGYPYYPQYPVDPRLNTPDMFSDENPNACSVM
ncbi:hypothetical protein SAY86_030923 [Trapa natans]|uniref:HMA domain-containing protein n=1 Tax=Trapa natans TaxID=22666 RepID=A0AAN7M5T5_TRANT|nr:hypothetical protein SAY86_030923 [Trapa natans]